MVVVNAVTQELYLSARDRPRFVLCDEAAQFMTRSDGQDLSRLAEAFSQGYRRARKYRGSFGIVLQSMNDLMLFGGTGSPRSTPQKWVMLPRASRSGKVSSVLMNGAPLFV